MLKVLFEIVIVYPPAPLKPVKLTVPDIIDIISVSSGAPISMPEWNVEAPEVGAFLYP